MFGNVKSYHPTVFVCLWLLAPFKWLSLENSKLSKRYSRIFFLSVFILRFGMCVGGWWMIKGARVRERDRVEKRQPNTKLYPISGALLVLNTAIPYSVPFAYPITCKINTRTAKMYFNSAYTLLWIIHTVFGTHKTELNCCSWYICTVCEWCRMRK